MQGDISAKTWQLLADLQGVPPPAPAWFEEALSDAPRRDTLALDGAALEVLAWGNPADPGVLLLHGNQAHADWWSFIAPFLHAGRHVVAPSWSGMGGSEWRSRYDLNQFADEIEAVARHSGMLAHPTKPIVIAHSFGTFPALRFAATRPDALAALISLDTPILSPEQRESRRAPRRDPQTLRPSPIYRDERSALARFRFTPPQHCDNLFLVDHIARRSLRPAPQDTPGCTWCFDPFMWRTLSFDDPTQDLAALRCTFAMVRGAESSLWSEDILRDMLAVAPAGTLCVDIPCAGHHLMMDQPLALVAVLRTLLTACTTAQVSSDADS